MPEQENKTPLEEQYVQFPMPAFLDLANLKEAEIKVLLYVSRHTRNYPNTFKQTLSADEIEHGRLRQDGSRMDKGTGLSNKSIVEACKSLVKKRYLFVGIEPGNQRSYGTRPWLPEHNSSTGYVKSTQANPSTETWSVKSTQPSSKIYIPAVNNLHSPSVESTQPMADQPAPVQATDESLNTLRDTSQNTFVDTSLAQKEKEEQEDEQTIRERKRDAWGLRMQIGRLEDDLERLKKSKLFTWGGKNEEQIKAEIQRLKEKLAALEE